MYEKTREGHPLPSSHNSNPNPNTNLYPYSLSLSRSRRLPSDRWNWSDESGVYERTREGHALPSSQWQWCGQWTQETRPGVTNDEGWQFAVDFPR